MRPSPHEPSTQSFYHLAQCSHSHRFCQGTACFVARHLNPDRWQQASTQEPRVYCLGKCYCAPSSIEDDLKPKLGIHSSESIFLENLIRGDRQNINNYLQDQGYQTIEKVLHLSPENIIHSIEISQLRGRGGAGFPTGKKMHSVYHQKSEQKYIIANADEGDPGSYIDRFLMEMDPHRLIESMVLTGYAIGAHKGYIYLRKEYPLAYQILQKALEESGNANYLGNRVIHSNFSFDIEIVIGQGSYVCGEETALIRSIEGKRPEVMPRPPYPTEIGLFSKPTLVLNVETLFNIPWILQHGAKKYLSLGFANSRGTKVISLNSLFQRPGIYEVEFGIPLRKIVEELGGGLKTGTLKGIMLAGPMGGIIPPDKLDVPLDFEQLRQIGANLGHGGLIAFDENTSIPELIHHIAQFAAYESCGKCTPCRLGSRQIEQEFYQYLQNRNSSKIKKKEITDIVHALADTSLCGLGIGLAEMANSTFRYYDKELESCFR